MTWLGMAAICSLTIALPTVLVTWVLSRKLQRVEHQLNGIHHRLGRVSARLGEVHEQIHETFSPLDCDGIETRTRTLPRQRGAEELS